MPIPQASIPNLMLHDSTDRSTVDPGAVVAKWFSVFEDVIDKGDVAAVKNLFLEDSWWRDILALNWSFRSSHTEELGDRIKDAQKAKMTNFVPFKTGVLVPQLADMGPFTLIESAFTFETKLGSGKGYIRLANSGPSEWKAWILMTNLQEIRGHEELHTKSIAPNWSSPIDHDKYETTSQKEPRVVILGGGHSGLSTAARLKQLGVPTLIVDKNDRVGASWRNRYKNLTLHDPKWENHMPYFRFPDTFPTWIPRQQIADWLETYQRTLQLPVSLDSTVTNAKWDESSRKWSIEIQKDGQTTYLHPSHLVLATGLHGETPNIPDFEGLKDFQGPVVHSTKFKTISHLPDYKSKKWVVIGSSASAHDVAVDIAENGADVTMIQRDANCAYTLNTKNHIMGAPFMKTGITTEDADVASLSMPFPVAVSMMVGGTQMIYQMDKELLDRVGKTEFKYLDGSDGRGLLHLVLTKGGGHYPDQGSLELIATGKIKVRQCYEGIKRITAHSVVLADGREVEADGIILATGYAPLKDTVRKIVGNDLAEKSTLGIAFSKHGELAGLFSSVGHPGLWWIAGSFAMNRPGSRNLALQIKAVEAGLNPEHYSMSTA